MHKKNEGPRSADRQGGGGRPTLKTIAFMTGLGVTTVSRALKDAPDIGRETRRRVQMVARQIGYRPNRAGVRLRTGKTNVISLIINTDEQIMSFVSDIIYGITESLSETPYHLILTPYSSSHDAMEPVRYVVETGSADGIIISRTEPDDPRVHYMHERGFPFATHGRTETGIAHAFHDFDNYVFARRAVEWLGRLGRRRLAVLGPAPHLTYHAHVTGGFSDGVLALGAASYPLSGLNIDLSFDRLRTGIAEIMRGPNPPDGFVSGAGAATFALVAGLEEAGLSLGREVDVVSKQSSDILRWFRQDLHVVNEDFRVAGRDLAAAVIARIDGEDPQGLQSLATPGDVISRRAVTAGA